MTAITLVLGDLTRQEVDAVVNAANHTILGGGGVDGAIHRAAGPKLLEACRRVRKTTFREGLPTGEAVATIAGDLPAQWVIHTVGPTWAKTIDKSGLLASCHTRSLAVADEVGARTVAFPAISTGAYHWPLDDAARIALASVREASTEVEEVRFVLRDERAYDVFAAELERQGL
ncbi:O-acetyl-ADP-ribose deacetylase [Microlunatus antarcticus]|uniref:O-acetyl-ADP-ribose deacetylase (Regulator of RNase III) n=1 Tax=Microlunatus antarcticus TaxID=53388 RepID=A0A7W5P5K1_9ACTN|nr:O-acetyl-ADP-ribose deacetylase [Microlunatus antarcticus]MBB3325463.1 O-acetyl-ADP-ribose deacetylase (regulator of RNase III) [Microlunatus antarcticus]